jgi:hypothetical protein
VTSVRGGWCVSDAGLRLFPADQSALALSQPVPNNLRRFPVSAFHVRDDVRTPVELADELRELLDDHLEPSGVRPGWPFSERRRVLWADAEAQFEGRSRDELRDALRELGKRGAWTVGDEDDDGIWLVVPGGNYRTLNPSSIVDPEFAAKWMR